MPETRFVCVGRRYPNGPAALRIGCEGRGFPRIWIVRIEFLTGAAAFLNDVPHFCYWHTTGQASPPDPWHRRNLWQKMPPIPGGANGVDVYVLWDGTRWQLELEIRVRVGLPTHFKHWRTTNSQPTFPNELPDGFVILEHDQSPGWTFGGSSAQVLVGAYDEIPADTCIGEDEI